jgi:uncharacterized protein YbjT (DUF2867 family)
MSRIIVIGGTGLIGSRVITRLTAEGHNAVSASPNSGVNTITGEGLAEALEGADTVLDVSNSPSFADEDVMAFFTTATGNIIEHAAQAGVTHYAALSVVGSEAMTESGYMRAKVAQEQLIATSGLPYSIVHATQFFEFVPTIAAGATVGDEIRLSHALIRPMAAGDVAAAVARITAGDPVNGTIEIAGPDEFGLDDLIRTGLAFWNDPRTVITDPDAPYFGQTLTERSLLPGPGALISETHFADWLTTAAPASAASK